MARISRQTEAHGDLFRSIFDVFGPRIGVPSPARTPLGALKGPQGPLRAPWGPQGAGISKPRCSGAALPRRGVFFRPKIDLCQKACQKGNKNESEGAEPPWRDPRRNSVQNGGGNAKNDHTATRLGPKRLLGGSLGVPGPASTPLGSPRGSQSLKTLIFLSILRGWS